ncbi:hypothetical protein BU26DRAFT_601465, partial [Trematosphaeria pertusa]
WLAVASSLQRRLLRRRERRRPLVVLHPQSGAEGRAAQTRARLRGKGGANRRPRPGRPTRRSGVFFDPKEVEAQAREALLHRRRWHSRRVFGDTPFQPRPFSPPQHAATSARPIFIIPDHQKLSLSPEVHHLHSPIRFPDVVLCTLHAHCPCLSRSRSATTITTARAAISSL